MRTTHENNVNTIRVSQESQITERFTRAIEQFGNQTSVTVRLGGIYALERIANDSEKDHAVVMELLTAFVREKSAWNSQAPIQRMKLDPDIQAILTVIGRRNAEYAKGHIVSLRGTDLRSANFTSANLCDIDFMDAHLEGAVFFGARMENATGLRDAYFADADFTHAHLEHALLTRSDLRGAKFIQAHLNRADFSDAIVDGAKFEYATVKEGQFSNAQLNDTLFEFSNLDEAILYNSQLKNAVLVATTLANAVLIQADIEGANLASAMGLTSKQIKLARNYTRSLLPPDIQSALQAESTGQSESV